LRQILTTILSCEAIAGREITNFDVIAFMAETTFPEETVSNHLMGIKLIQNRVRVLIDRSGMMMMMIMIMMMIQVKWTHLSQTGGKNDHLIELTHFSQEFVDAGSFENMEMMPVVF